MKRSICAIVTLLLVLAGTAGHLRAAGDINSLVDTKLLRKFRPSPKPTTPAKPAPRMSGGRVPRVIPTLIGPVLPASDTWPKERTASQLLGISENSDLVYYGDYGGELISSGTLTHTSVTYVLTWDSPYSLRMNNDWATGSPNPGDVNSSDPNFRNFYYHFGADFQIKWYVHGVACTGWLDQPFTFTLGIGDSCLAGLDDGVHDVSIDWRDNGSTNWSGLRDKFTYLPAYLIIDRGGTWSDLVPILSRECSYCNYFYNDNVRHGTGARVMYVDVTTLDTHGAGHPARTDVRGAWHDPPYAADLYMEEMAPRSNLFNAYPHLFELDSRYGARAGKKYIRQMYPKVGDTWQGLYHGGDAGDPPHSDLPITDGPRGVGWTSGYIAGQVAAVSGNLYYAENASLREMHPDGELETIAGYRVAPGHEPIWYNGTLQSGPPTANVRDAQELVGDWQEGAYPFPYEGFHGAFDVAIDPNDDEHFLVAAFEDHCIWDVQEGAGAGGQARVFIFAGTPAVGGGCTAGYANGTGHAATFNGPTSVVWDPTNDLIYIADAYNDDVRVCTRAAVCTVKYGFPDGTPHGSELARLSACCTFNWTTHPEGNKSFQTAARTAADTTSNGGFTIDSTEALAGHKPDIYFPFTVRVTHDGNLVVNDVGFGSVRLINVTTNVTTYVAGIYSPYLSETGAQWSWMDVDRYGNSGPLDGVYLGVSQGSHCEGSDALGQGSHPNEQYCWAAIDGSTNALFIFIDADGTPDGWGHVRATDPPHYFWMAVVDPLGGVYFSGMGEHGMTRLRPRIPADVVPESLWPACLPEYFCSGYFNGNVLWHVGGCDGCSPLEMVYGPEGHNYIGMPDLWDYDLSVSDATLISDFGLRTDLMTSDEQTYVLRFMHLNIGTPPAPDSDAPGALHIVPRLRIRGLHDGTITLIPQPVGVR